jgi:hypothetical protein
MDPFIRNYSIILGIIVLIVLGVLFYESPEVRSLNKRLAEQTELTEYPYRFRVLDVNSENGTVTLTTPRTQKFNAFRALRIIFPSLANEDDDSQRLYDAQLDLARVQELAAATVLTDPDMKRVRWELDERWLRDNGIDPDLL